MKKQMMILILLLSVGCSRKIEDEILYIPVQSYNDVSEDVQYIDNEVFQLFFEEYFDLSEEERLLLNSKDDEKDTVQALYRQKLSPYSVDGEGSFEVLHVPRLVKVDEYITLETISVEEVEVISVRELGEDVIYQIEVTTIETVIDIIGANNEYSWSEEIGYYHRENTPDIWQTFKVMPLEQQGYFLLQQTPGEHRDELRVSYSYDVTCKNNAQELKAIKVEERNTISQQEEIRLKAENNGHVERLPYEPIDDLAAQVALEVWRAMIEAPKTFWQHYEEAAKEGAESLATLFNEQLGLTDKIIVPKEYYNSAYHQAINPYKDMIASIKIIEENIVLSNDATLRQPRFKIISKIEALLHNNQKVYYTYEYLVGLEQEQVEFIHFISIQPVD